MKNAFPLQMCVDLGGLSPDEDVAGEVAEGTRSLLSAVVLLSSQTGGGGNAR